jgi:glycosyltransferase involved in cell wall biosynthesis
MSEWPKISVVTPSFNSIHTLRQTLESVRSQEYPNWEHIVMDGGSTDGTVELLKSSPHLIWESEKDPGHYYAMNKGIQRARGDIVNILNSDDCLRPGALRAVGEAFREHPDWAALFGDVVYVDGAGREIYRREEAGYDYDVLRYSVGYVIHQALFVRKSAYDELGLYRCEDFVNCCDYEFELRLGRHGRRVGHVPRLLIDYRYHEHGQSADLRVTRNAQREALRIRREYGAPDGWRGRVYYQVFRAKRQWQKLTRRGHCDLLPGSWILYLRGHMKRKTRFASNIDLQKLERQVK